MPASWPASPTKADSGRRLRPTRRRWPCSVRAIERAGYRPGHDAVLSLDIAASELLHDGRYRLALERRTLDRDQMLQLLLDWLDRYPIASIEDPFGEDDRDGWIAFARAAPGRVQIVGDDLPDDERAARRRRGRGAFVQRGADQGQPGGNADGDQVRARRRQARQLRHDRVRTFGRIGGRRDRASGGRLERRPAQGRFFARGERTAKWNEVLRIEEALQGAARFAGAQRCPRVG